MTRTLTFDGPRAARRFQLLWVALTAGGDGKDRTAAVVRRDARLQEAFETISVPAPQLNAADPDRELRPEGGAVTLAQEDFEQLQQYTEKTPWIPRVARDVVDAWDWLSTAEKRD